MATDIHTLHLELNGQPLTCETCDAAADLVFVRNGPFKTGPAIGNCPAGHHWDDLIVTTAVLDSILANRTGRQKVEDQDLFEVETLYGILSGELVPEVTVADMKYVGEVYWKKVIKPLARMGKRKAKAKARHAIRAPFRAAAGAAKDATAVPVAAALDVDWQLRAGGTEDIPRDPDRECAACSGEGSIALDSRAHPGRVRCALCHGTGEI